MLGFEKTMFDDKPTRTDVNKLKSMLKAAIKFSEDKCAEKSGFFRKSHYKLSDFVKTFDTFYNNRTALNLTDAVKYDLHKNRIVNAFASYISIFVQQHELIETEKKKDAALLTVLTAPAPNIKPLLPEALKSMGSEIAQFMQLLSKDQNYNTDEKAVMLAKYLSDLQNKFPNNNKLQKYCHETIKTLKEITPAISIADPELAFQQNTRIINQIPNSALRKKDVSQQTDAQVTDEIKHHRKNKKR